MRYMYVRMMDIDRHTSLHPFYNVMRTCTNMHHNKSYLVINDPNSHKN